MKSEKERLTKLIVDRAMLYVTQTHWDWGFRRIDGGVAGPHHGDIFLQEMEEQRGIDFVDLLRALQNYRSHLNETGDEHVLSGPLSRIYPFSIGVEPEDETAEDA